jgi:signal transduction histidine kinase
MGIDDSASNSESNLSSLLYGIAHTLRNPLFGISATLDAFESRHGNQEEFVQYFNVIRSEIDRMTTLVQMLSDYGRSVEPNPTECNVEKLIDKSIRSCIPFAQKARVSIEKRLYHDSPSIVVDESRILMALCHVIQNAIEHTPTGGVVTFLVEDSRDSSGNYMSCTICDTGPGFRPEDLARAFEPFFSRNSRKIGLGLTIARRIILEHEGEIDISNLPDGGAEVTIKLPLSKN